MKARQPLLRLYLENRRYIPGLALILLISLLAGGLKLAASTLWGQAVDFGVAGRISPMLWGAGAMALVILVDCARTAVHYHIIGRVTETMFRDVRMKAFRKLTTGDAATLERDFRTGDTATRLNSDIDVLNNFTAGHVSNFSRLLFQGVVALAGCLFLSWQMSLAYLVVLPLSLWVVKRVSAPIQAKTKSSLDSTGAAMSVAAEAIQGALTVKAFGAEEELARRFDAAVDSATQQKVQSEKISQKLTGVKYAANVIQTMALFLLGSVLVTRGAVSVGTLVSFLALSNYITEPFGQLDYMISQVRRATATAQRYFEVMDVPDEADGPVTRPASLVPCQAQELAFSYDGKNRVLQDITLRIAQGQQVAVVGESGCGKSTLLRMLCRFYLPQAGSLRLFGVEAKDWQGEALRQHIALVTQNSTLFDGSVYENVAYGKPGLTRAECRAALEAVELWDFVSQFPDGMDHPIGEGGAALSGGQKQRLCIARALVKEAPLVLLDEATSALDTQTEKEVQAALDKLLAGRSAVIVAHRLTTVQNAHYIYVLEQGHVLEEGPPKELLAKRGRYYEMCKLQGLAGEEAGT
mgnify:FL=1